MYQPRKPEPPEDFPPFWFKFLVGVSVILGGLGMIGTVILIVVLIIHYTR